MERIGHYLGLAIGSYANVFAPELVVVGGFAASPREAGAPAPSPPPAASRCRLPTRRSGSSWRSSATTPVSSAPASSASRRSTESGEPVPLLVCATPIGNLEDVTLRVLAALRDADAVLCEDTRRTQVLLDRHGIRARSLVSFHRHNEARRCELSRARLEAEETHALVSDAGLPGSTTRAPGSSRRHERPASR